MTRRFLVAALVVLAAVPIYVRAQSTPTKGMPISGSVVDVVGGPIPNAQVTLYRHTLRVQESEGFEMLAHGVTDAQGQFQFGEVALKNEVHFPIETGVSLEFGVVKEGAPRVIDNVRFTAPRTNDAVTSVAAEISVH